ncbi:hypothetical protein [Bacillus mycoides]|uniref:hypothetical protein n=1 Tax=Bacillus mycoides TaxID=1405 RepID=UPI000B4A606E|nr:hypothetical protein [Bacillus mycoides]
MNVSKGDKFIMDSKYIWECIEVIGEEVARIPLSFKVLSEVLEGIYNSNKDLPGGDSNRVTHLKFSCVGDESTYASVDVSGEKSPAFESYVKGELISWSNNPSGDNILYALYNSVTQNGIREYDLHDDKGNLIGNYTVLDYSEIHQ